MYTFSGLKFLIILERAPRFFAKIVLQKNEINVNFLCLLILFGRLASEEASPAIVERTFLVIVFQPE